MSDDGVTGGFAERLGARAEVADDGSARVGVTAGGGTRGGYLVVC
jgi:hypothetical protein